MSEPKSALSSSKLIGFIVILFFPNMLVPSFAWTVGFSFIIALVSAATQTSFYFCFSSLSLPRRPPDLIVGNFFSVFAKILVFFYAPLKSWMASSFLASFLCNSVIYWRNSGFYKLFFCVLKLRVSLNLSTAFLDSMPAYSSSLATFVSMGLSISNLTGRCFLLKTMFSRCLAGKAAVGTIF